MTPPKKRMKLSKDEQKPSLLPIEGKHRVFTTWAAKRGVKIHNVIPARLPGRGLGLVTTAPIKEGERILFVPENAMLKPDALLMKRSGLERASPHLKLATTAMLKCKVAESPFEAWEVTWPTTLDFEQTLPLCWSEDLCKELPVSVYSPLERQRDDYAKDWQAVEKLCKSKGLQESDFRYYWMIVNSRSFHWKPPHGRAGSMVMCPFIDYMNHGPTGTSCNVFQSPEGYEVNAQRDYATGEEVLATYGAHSNDKLLIHYGFLNASTPVQPSSDDEIRLDSLIIPHLPDNIKSQLQDVGFLGAHALLPSRDAPPSKSEDARIEWEPCFKTQVAVRAVLLTANEWEYFVSSGEDLSGDKTAVVRKWLVPILKGYRDEAAVKAASSKAQKPDSMSDEAYESAVGLIRARWTQVREAMDGFLMA